MHEWGDDLFERKRGNASGDSAQVGNTKKEICGTGVNQGNFCLKCNAWRGSLGLEPTYQMYIKHLIHIFDEVKRVLKDTGSCWVNLGDTYSNNSSVQAKGRQGFGNDKIGNRNNKQLQEKSLIGIPERFMLAMIDKGWILRNKIIWYKKNTMPSSASDRFTVDWEALFFFTKKPQYYFEQQFEPLETPLHTPGNKFHKDKIAGPMDRKGHSQWEDRMDKVWGNPQGRNRRTVWKLSTEPYPDAHFATYPEKLCETPIKAGCPKDGVVLDPFMGSGTTLKVARELGRKGIGIELNQEYIDMAVKRINLKQSLLEFK